MTDANITAETNPQPSYSRYWITWGILLVLTAAMLALEMISFSKILLAVFLITFMALKASLIGGRFMHLRSERKILILAVVVPVVFLSTFLFVLISFDGTRILKMVQMLRP